MFSGIIESVSPLLTAQSQGSLLILTIEKPSIFDDVHLGDSIAVDGVCLTVEAQQAHSLSFSAAAETLQVTGWSVDSLKGHRFNLERSLQWGGRLHGHFVTGHVDALGQVLKFQAEDGCVVMEVQVPALLKPLIWRKGSVAINGVSLTVNEVESELGTFTVCLIPETLKRTNLGQLQAGATVHLEADQMARGMYHMINSLTRGEQDLHGPN